LVARVEGDFTTVVGLPIGRLLPLLEECGLAPWQR
jgi:predicted house-cleaning NTP pyrophosphatase (Maf/HAM1 superfamily)